MFENNVQYTLEFQVPVKTILKQKYLHTWYVQSVPNSTVCMGISEMEIDTKLVNWEQIYPIISSKILC